MIVTTLGDGTEVRVYFGGTVSVGLGTLGKDGPPSISLQSLDLPAQIGADVLNAPTRGPRVLLVFSNPESVDVVMKLLRKAKARLVKPPPVEKVSVKKTKKKEISGGEDN